MEWQLALLLIFGSLILLIMTGMPVAFSLLLVNLIGLFLFFGGEVGLGQLALSIFSAVARFSLLPLPLFILMGEVILHSGMATLMMDALDKCIGRLPGRLSLLAVGGGTLFATLTGADIANVAMLGSTLVPEMQKRGYKKPMSIGPILGSGGLAIMIPPSGLAVLLGAIARISIAGILIGIIVPGILMAIIYASYIVIRCWLQPSLAPAYQMPPTPLMERVMPVVKYILPVGLVIFLVTGVIVLGIATPTEAAATGAAGCFILVALYRRLNWDLVKKAVGGTINITVMVFMIIVGAVAFGQNMSMAGASKGLIEFAVGLPLPPIFIMLTMQALILFLGTFMEMTAIMMVTLPLYMPVIITLGFDPVWFAVIYLLNIEISGISPPFGLALFVMKGVAPPDVTIGDIYKAALPFVGINLIVMALLMAFPLIVLWLPGLMR